jgi:hypothetical protein
LLVAEPTLKRIAYAVERSGQQEQTVQVCEVDTGKLLSSAQVPLRTVAGQHFQGENVLFVHGFSEAGVVLLRVALDTGASARIELPGGIDRYELKVLRVLDDGGVVILVTQGEPTIGVWDPAGRRWSWQAPCRDAREWIFTRASAGRLRVLVRGELVDYGLGSGEALDRRPVPGVSARTAPGFADLGADPLAVLDGVTLKVFSRPRDRALPLAFTTLGVPGPGRILGLTSWGAAMTWAVDALPEK